MAAKSVPVTERILRNSIPEPNSGCWLWTGTLKRRGYGEIYIGNKKRTAHRISFEAFNGPIPSNWVVCHRCDVTCCVNPAHLFIGTQADNMRDMYAKGRNIFGAKRKTAKLTDNDVRAIRNDSRRNVDIARAYGISETVASRVRRGIYWKHVK